MDSAVSIREAKAADAPEIARVHITTWQVAYRGQLSDAFLDGLSAQSERRRAFWERWISSVAPSRGQTALVAEVEGRVVGFVTFGPAEDEPRDPLIGEIYAIYLEPRQWNRGYGRALFGAAVDGLRDRGYREATLWVLDTNARTRRFYEIAGWVADGAVKVDQRGGVPLHEVRYRCVLRF
jgi:GNAT superfamily N-acetyltransferase